MANIEPSPAAPSELAARTPCANCSHELAADYCTHCGQHRRGSEVLRVREVLSRACEHLLDFDSAFLRTFVGLFRRPGEVCREYMQGRRKRYMNPIAYFVLSGTVGLLVSAFAGWLTEARVAPDEEFIADHALWILLAMLVPLAVTWSKLFAQSGYNLAENYVFALYVLAQFTWLETLILLPLTCVASDVLLVIAYLAATFHCGTAIQFARASSPAQWQPWQVLSPCHIHSTIDVQSGQDGRRGRASVRPIDANSAAAMMEI